MATTEIMEGVEKELAERGTCRIGNNLIDYNAKIGRYAISQWIPDEQIEIVDKDSGRTYIYPKIVTRYETDKTLALIIFLHLADNQIA